MAWDDDESETRVFFQPEDELAPAQRVPVPRPAPAPLPELPMRFAQGTVPMRLHDETVDGERFSIPSLAQILEPDSLATMAVPRRRAITRFRIGVAAACAVVGITIGAAIAVTGHASVATLVPARASQPIVTPIVQDPALVTLHVESTPPGATVLLVGDAGATTLVGTTPVDTQVEAARDYDVLVKLPNRAPRIEHVAAAGSHQLAIAF